MSNILVKVLFLFMSNILVKVLILFMGNILVTGQFLTMGNIKGYPDVKRHSGKVHFCSHTLNIRQTYCKLKTEGDGQTCMRHYNCNFVTS